MRVRICWPPWFVPMLQALADLERIGFKITDEHIDRLIESALTIEVD